MPPTISSPAPPGSTARSSTSASSLPRLGKRRVADIGRADAAALHHEMRAVPGHANRTLGVLSRMLTMAEVWEMRPEGVNLCRFVKKYPEREGFASPAAIAAIRLLMLTGCRSGEILSLRWEHVDLDRASCGSPIRRLERRSCISARPAVAVLRGIERAEDSPWVLPGQKPGAHLAFLHGPWYRILKRSSIENLRIHDLRHSFASRALALGEGLPMIGKLLGHHAGPDDGSLCPSRP